MLSPLFKIGGQTYIENLSDQYLSFNEEPVDTSMVSRIEDANGKLPRPAWEYYGDNRIIR